MEKDKRSYKNNRFKISAPTWNEKIELTDGSYSLLDVQDSFKYVIKEHETVRDNSSIRLCVNQIKNRIIFRINTGYLRLLTPATMKLIGSTKSEIAKD